MRLISVAALCVASLVCTATLRAQDLVRESVVEKWLDEYTPEKLPELKYPAYFNQLDKARMQVFRGRYKLALITLQQVEKADAAEVALVKAAALAATGRREEALAVLSDGPIADRPKVQVQRARVLAELGRSDEAVALLRQYLAANPDSPAGHYYLGEVCETVGDLPAAKEQYEWIHKTYFEQWQGQGAKEFEDAEMVTLMGRGFDRWATLNSAYANNAPLNNLIFKVFVQAYDIIDRDYLPAHVAAAEFYFRHENHKEAQEELKAATALNPNDARALELLGLIAVEQFNFDGADKAIALLRRVDSTSIRADLLEVRDLLQQRRPKDAEVPARRVLSVQPKNIEAMGLLAASYELQLKADKAKEVLAQVEKLDPDNATAYLAVAEQLGAMRQYPRSEKMYEIAIERAPWWTAARNGLGLLLTQSGDEDKARTVLDAAYSVDPFNMRTTNYLILLDKMAKMARKESEHFVLMYDAANDPVVPEYFLEYMESIHKEVCAVFKTEPPVKTYIEVFPSHDQFSARITGSPWIGTVGASTGRIIALCAPRRGDNTLGTFNWAQVLRHEYTHTVTLAATDNRIGHWMTEGLAVVEERIPLRWEWVPMLYNAVKKKQLFSMENLTWAFVRPKRPQDRALAYAQSYWICEYIEEKWGHPTILKMMDEFKQGKGQDEVFQDVLGLSLNSFSEEFFAWTEKQVAGWGYDEETTKKYDELTAKAENLIKARQYKEAAEAWEEIAKLRPMDQLPHQRLAGIYLSKEASEPQKALAHLIRLHQVASKDDRFAKRIARLSLESNDLPTAEKYALQAVYVDPYDVDAHELLLSVQEKAGNADAAEREKRVIPLLKEWVKSYRKSTLIEGAPLPE